MRPMLATPSGTVPRGDDWRHEVKWDGMRILADVRDHRLTLWSRTERDVTVAFPELVSPDAGLTAYEDLLLDGEAVVLRDGRPSFAALAERFNVTSPREAARLAAAAPVTLMVFDVLRVMGHDLLARPWRERREVLTGAALNTRRVQTSAVFEDGAGLEAATAEHDLEGVVSKRLGSAYHPGRRSPDWRKVVHRRRDSFVVGGWRPEAGSARLGAVLVGTPAAGGLTFRGRVGSGLAGVAGERLHAHLVRLRQAQSPFIETLDRADADGSTWVRPVLVGEVEFREISEGGRLRAPTWQGVRPDLEVADLAAEAGGRAP